MKHFLIILLGLSFVTQVKATNAPAKKYLDITFTSKGLVFMWPDTLTADGLAEAVEQRLWKSYLGTGKMYDEIRINYETGSEKQADALKAIKEGQSKALTQVCLQKNRKTYEELTPRQQKKIRRQFPVLFQELQ